MASSRRRVISSAAARPKFLVLVCFLPWFLIRSGLCRSIPLACWDSMGASTWGGGHGNADQGRGVFSPSHLFPHRFKIYLICFKWRCWFEYFFFVLRLLLEIWPSSAHHHMIFSAIRSTCVEISWGYCWLESHVSYSHHFFLCCSLMRQRRGIIWTCFWGRFVSSA